MAKIKLPEQVKVGPYMFEVLSKDSKWASDQGREGECSTETMSLSVVSTRPPLVVLDTLLHELIHSIYYVFHITDEDKEEETTAKVATGLVTAFRDNPDLVKFMNRMLKLGDR